MEEPGKGSRAWTPISADLLPARPQIVGQLEEGLLERWVTLERLTGSDRASKTPHINNGLDLSTHTELEKVAHNIGRFLIDDYDEEIKTASGAARALDVNDSAVLGVVEVGHVTAAHTHLNGVIHWCGKGGRKLWSFKNNMLDGQRDDDDDFVLLQEAGCLLWLPPGWSHEVRTLQGSMCNGRELCMHWVSWFTPFAFFERALLAFACGVISESQSPRRRPTIESTRRLHALVHEMEARKRARSFEGRHVRVGSEHQAVIPEYQCGDPDEESRHESPGEKRKFGYPA